MQSVGTALWHARQARESINRAGRDVKESMSWLREEQYTTIKRALNEARETLLRWAPRIDKLECDVVDVLEGGIAMAGRISDAEHQIGLLKDDAQGSNKYVFLKDIFLLFWVGFLIKDKENNRKVLSPYKD